jgi:glycosyltransferase involved in cell wall biosynthesis
VHHLREHGYRAELVAIPFKWYPKQEILAHAAAWRLLDLSESNGQAVDLVIATKFPSYFLRHPDKVTWLVHQYRAAYELCGTPFSDFDYTELDVGLRETLLTRSADAARSRRLFTISRTISGASNASASRRAATSAEAGAEPAPGAFATTSCRWGHRVDQAVDLAVAALAHTRSPLRLVVVGEGTQRENVMRAAERAGVADRVDFLGAVDDERLCALYAGSLAVVYAPYDEDYGYVTLEAFLSGKPVITARDSGGTLEFVEDCVNGRVCEPTPDAIGAAMNDLAASRRLAASYGDAGLARACTITWHGVIENLVSSQEPVGP